MLLADRSALLCDLAETYGVFDLRELPVFTMAALASGLRDNSRIRMKMRGGTAYNIEELTARLYDLINELIWAMGFYGKESDKPLSLTDRMRGIVQQVTDKGIQGYKSPEAFEEERKKLLGG